MRIIRSRMPRPAERVARLIEIGRGDAVIIGILAVADADDAKCAFVIVRGIRETPLRERDLCGRRERGRVMGAVFGVRVPVDRERASGAFGGFIKRRGRVRIRGLCREQREREVRACRGDVDVGCRVHAAVFEDRERRAQFVDRLCRAPRLAVEHRQVVVERSEPSVVGSVDVCGACERLRVEVFGLGVVTGRALRCRRVDERRRPRFGAFESKAQREFDRALDDPLVVLVPRLRTVESHRLVEHGEQAGHVSGVLGGVHRVDEVRFRLRRRLVAREDGVKAAEETVDVESVVLTVVCAVRIRAAVRIVHVRAMHVRAMRVRIGRMSLRACAEHRQFREQIVLVIVRHRSSRRPSRASDAASASLTTIVRHSRAYTPSSRSPCANGCSNMRRAGRGNGTVTQCGGRPPTM